MKRIYLIGGTMGVGKTTVCQALKSKLRNCVFLDGDWCWDANPFRVTSETKEMVMGNICFLLSSFIHCSAYDCIIFGWVMHEQSIIDTIVERLDADDCRILPISLTADEANLKARLQKDILTGKRQPDILARSIARIPLYQSLNTIKIDTNNKSAADIAEEIIAL